MGLSIPEYMEKVFGEFTPLEASHVLGFGSEHALRMSWLGTQGKPEDKVLRDALRSLGLQVTTWESSIAPGKVFMAEIVPEKNGVTVGVVLQAMIAQGATHGVVFAEGVDVPDLSEWGQGAGQSAGDTLSDFADWWGSWGGWVVGLTLVALAGGGFAYWWVKMRGK